MSFIDDLRNDKLWTSVFSVDIEDFNNALKEDFDFVIDTLVNTPQAYSLIIRDNFDFSGQKKEELERILESKGYFSNPELSRKLTHANLKLTRIIKEKTDQVYDLYLRAHYIHDSEEAMKILETYQTNNGRVPPEVANLTFASIMQETDYNLSDYLSMLNYENIKSVIADYKGSPVYIPFDRLNEKQINLIYKDDLIDEKEYKGIMLLKENKTQISNEEERNLLDLLGYTKYNSIEDVIKEKKNKLCNSIEDRLIIKAYSLKYLNANNIYDCEVNAFLARGVDSDIGMINGNAMGDKLVNIFNNPSLPLSYQDLLHVIHHEIAHVIQTKDMKSIDVEKDEDILEYSKDSLLRVMCDDKFYKDNYYRFSNEFDADFKARFETNKLFGIAEENEYELFKSNEQYLDKLAYRARYKSDLTRNDKSISEFFDEKFKFYIEDASKRDAILEQIKNYYPIILYEYNLEGEMPVKRSNKEIIDLMSNCSLKDKKIYKNILKSRSSEYKSGKEEAIKNRNEIKGYLNRDFTGYLREVINENKGKFYKYEAMLTKSLVQINKELKTEELENSVSRRNL